jgi:hypothetical protein
MHIQFILGKGSLVLAIGMPLPVFCLVYGLLYSVGHVAVPAGMGDGMKASALFIKP